MAEDQNQSGTEIKIPYIPPCILSTFAEIHDVDISTATEMFNKRAHTLIKMYSGNASQAFWSESDMKVVHVVIMHHLLNRLDTEAVINDVELYETVLSRLPQLLEKWITETNRQAFDESVKAELNLPIESLELLKNTLSTVLVMLDGNKDELVHTPDDAKLFDIVTQAKTLQKREGWAKLRLDLVQSILAK